MTTRYGTVLFDLDFTLLDSETSMAEAFAAAAAVVGLADAHLHRSAFDRINGELWRDVERQLIRPDDVRVRRFERFLDELGIDADPAVAAPEMAEAFVVGLIDHGDLYPAANHLLDTLADRSVGLLTNGIGRVQRGRLRRLGLEDRFDAIAISGELSTAKPAAAIFDHVLAAVGDPDRSEVVMVGDNWDADIVGAHNAGIAAVWVNSASLDPGGAAGQVVEVSSIGEVGPLLG